MDRSKIERINELPLNERVELLQKLKKEQEDGLKKAEEMLSEAIIEMENEEIQKIISSREQSISQIIKEAPLEDNSLESSALNEDTQRAIQAAEYRIIKDYEELRNIAAEGEMSAYAIERLEQLNENFSRAETYTSVSETISNIIDTAKSISYSIMKYHE